MAFDFPSTPTVGQTWPNPPVAGQPVYTWDGEKWTSGTGYGAIYIADAAPAAPVGSLWWNSATGRLYVRYFDGDSAQWAAVISGGPADVVRYGAVQTLTSAQQTQARQNIAAAPLDGLAYNGMQVNGSFDVNQDTLIEYTTPFAYISDGGWRYYFVGASLAVSARVVNGVGFVPVGLQYFAQMVPTTAKPTLAADDFVQMFTNIEGSRTARLAWGTASARPITIGFWSAHKRTGVYSIVINSNLTPHRSYATTYSQVVSEKWEYHVVTIPGCTDGNWPNDNTGSIGLSFAMASGVTKTTPTTNVWMTTSYNAAPGQVNAVAATTDVFRITGVVVLPGIEAPPAERAPYIMRPYDQELLTCQRYYEIGQGPTIYYGTLPSGSVNYDSVRFSVRKRATPTLTFNGWQYWSGGSAVAFNPVVRTGTLDQFSFQILGATNFQGWDGGNATWIASARL